MLFQKAEAFEKLTPAPERPGVGGGPRDRADRARVIEIGLVNNMGDAALRATERQFLRLLKTGAGGRPVRLHRFALPSVPRSPVSRQRIDSLYAGLGDLRRCRLDGLIVTGAEPRAARLRDEPYWDELRALVDWAEANTRSTIWSCLAAHAAVLHLDGIERRRLPRKCSGVYPAERLQSDALLHDLALPLRVPHSRLNDLPADRLANAGYDLLTHAPDVGVDTFARPGRSRFVFFQGHPEYDVASLQREYLRDIGRFLTGERDDFPEMPANYFDTATEAALAGFRTRAEMQRAPVLISDLPTLAVRPGLSEQLEATATALFRNWLSVLASDR